MKKWFFLLPVILMAITAVVIFAPVVLPFPEAVDSALMAAGAFLFQAWTLITILCAMIGIFLSLKDLVFGGKKANLGLMILGMVYILFALYMVYVSSSFAPY